MDLLSLRLVGAIKARVNVRSITRGPPWPGTEVLMVASSALYRLSYAANLTTSL